MEQRVRTTYLEMRSRDQAAPFRGERVLEVRHAELPSPELSRFFYQAVGEGWWWYSRLAWPRAQWQAWVDRPELETWIAYRQGTPAGYFELERQPGAEVEIVYFGLLPAFIGIGLGTELLCSAIERAWRAETRRVWLHTCSLDHPTALPNYEARGFVVYDVKEDVERLPDEPLRLWPETSDEAPDER